MIGYTCDLYVDLLPRMESVSPDAALCGAKRVRRLSCLSSIVKVI